VTWWTWHVWWTRNAFVQWNAICASNAFIIPEIFISYDFYVISDRKSRGNCLISLTVDMSPLCSETCMDLATMVLAVKEMNAPMRRRSVTSHPSFNSTDDLTHLSQPSHELWRVSEICMSSSTSMIASAAYRMKRTGSELWGTSLWANVDFLVWKRKTKWGKRGRGTGERHHG